MNEKVGNQVAFYFMTGLSRMDIDGNYSILDPMIQKLIKTMHSRNHEIGFHPSYETYLKRDIFSAEAKLFLNTLEQIGINQDKIGGRQHYLRWSTPKTARNWEFIGFDYDSTLGFADLIGFRCGICYEYQFYDVLKRKKLELYIRPLVAMETTIFSPEYMNIDNLNLAYDLLDDLKSKCYMYNGDFTLLWHNFFSSNEHKYLYQNIIRPK